MSLRARLALGTVVTLAVAVCAGLIGAYFVVRAQLASEIDTALRDRATALVTLSRHQPAPPPSRPVRLPRPKLGGAAGYVQFVDQDGRVILPMGERIRLPTSDARAVAAGRRRSFFIDATVAGTHLRIYVTAVNAHRAAEIARPLTEVDQALARIRLLFLIAALATLAAGAVIGTAVARAALRPVERLTQHAERIAATGDLNERTNERRSDELGRLAHAFNTMLDALSRSVSAQRQLVADASHELRTPLAAARANVELLELHPQITAEERRRLLGDASAELREMTSLTDGLVELARTDAAVANREPVRLDQLTEDVVATAARRSDTPFETQLEPTLVHAAPTALGRAIANLIDNAVKWSPQRQPVEITVRDGAVTVRDHGPGIDPSDLPYIFDRFYRAPSARTLPGSGLGLAIARQVAEALGGTVTAGSAEGGGAAFILSLPVVHES
jgi:two-component system, OmpR family, sensor histidine kinase MprB